MTVGSLDQAEPELRPCPRCGAFARLAPNEGALHEAICGRCLGRFLPGDAREAILAELQVDDGMLRELMETFAGETLTCPGCGFTTSEIRLRGRSAHVCRGCGGMWLDQGDLSGVTDERHREVGVTEHDPSQLPEKPKPFADHERADEAPGYRQIQLVLFAGWVMSVAGLRWWLDKQGVWGSMRLLYLLMGTSGYVLWFLPTLVARKKKALLKIFAANAGALLFPVAWPGVAGWSVVAPTLEQAKAKELREGERSRARLPSRDSATPESATTASAAAGSKVIGTRQDPS